MKKPFPDIPYRSLLISVLSVAAFLLVLFAAGDYLVSIIFDNTKASYQINSFNENEGMYIAFALPWISLALSVIVGWRYVFANRQQVTSPPAVRKQSWFFRIIWRRLLKYSKTSRVHLVQILACLMWSVFSVGWVLFYLAWWDNCQDNGAVDTPLGLFLYSGTSAINMFLLSINDNLIDNIAGHDLLKTAIILTYIMALMSTTMLVLGLIFSRLISKTHSAYLKPTPDDNNNLYVFFGTNEPSRLLARDIKKNDAKSLILFVESPVPTDTDDNNSLSSIVNFFTQRKEVFAAVDQDEHEGLLIANQRIEDIEDVDGDFWKHLGLKKMQQLLDNELIEGAHFFFLSDDRDSNVAATIKLSEYLNHKVNAESSNNKSQERKDESTASSDESQENKEITSNEVESKRKYKVYCLARLDGVSQTIQEFLPKQKIYVYVIDNSKLSVECLRRNLSNHPIRFVDVDTYNNPGTVTSDFHSLVIGFGETGRDTVKFLYEFGAFPSSDSDPGRKTYRAKFDCKVVDTNIEVLSGKFKASRPAIFDGSRWDNTGNISFYSIDVRSDDFYSQVLTKDYINKLNYVVVSVGDEEQNLSIALDILRFAVKYRKNLEKFKILVRVYQGDKAWYFDKIIKHYNDSLRYNDESPVIEMFGDNKSIYLHSIIINDELKDMAIEYSASYERIRTNDTKINIITERNKWVEARKDAFTQCVGKMENLGKYRRKKYQNISNALHKDTKIYIMRLVYEDMIRRRLIEDGLEESLITERVIDEHLQDLYSRIFEDDVNTKKTGGVGSKDAIKYTYLSDQEMRLMTNLAVLEHMRWNASHEMLGYVGTRGKDADDLHLLHNCLYNWEELDDISAQQDWPCDYKNYDFIVVETSLSLWCRNNLQAKNESQTPLLQHL